jgi:hypothetical protein
MFGGSFESHLGGTSDTETETGTLSENNFHFLIRDILVAATAVFGNNREHAFQNL